MRDRLIELLSDAEREHLNYEMANKFCPFDDYKCHSEYIADYLLKNGVVVPPCKVGQKVWKLMYGLIKSPAEIIEGKVSMLQQKADGTWKIRITRRSSIEDVTLDEIGKTVFLTREDAEMALKGGAE